MSIGSSGIFSAQAVAISLALHAVVLGGLYSLGTFGEKPPVTDAPAIKPEVAESEKTPAEKTEVVPPEPPKSKPDVPEKKEIVANPEKPKVKTDDKPAQIRIEPRPDDKLENDAPASKVDIPAKKDDPPPAKDKPASGKMKVYVVKRGDTLTALAKECGLTVQELAALNGKTVKKMSNLWVGQKIKLPVADRDKN